MRPTRHLVTLWSPARAANALADTVQLLLNAAGDHRAGKMSEEDVYVWWGKVKSSNRQAPLPHLAEVISIDEHLRGDDGPAHEVHLYLTDFRSLYVAHVGEVTADDIIAEGEDNIPAFYRDEGMKCDCWFRLHDIRRVVADDTSEVVRELAKLRNTRYNDRPVSIYGGMVDLPLIVTRDDGARFFEADVRQQLTDGRYWVEFDAERTGVGRMEQELRDNVLGEDTWNALDPAARTFVATEESLFREHRNDPAFDFATIVVNFAKALEVQVNLTLRSAAHGVPERDRLVNVDGRTVDLARGTQWTLGQLAHAIADDRHVNDMLKRRLVNGEWFAASLPPVLRELAELRNRAAHGARIGRDTARTLRDRMLGIGELGIINQLGHVRPR
jgi:hypothetical protein